MPVPVKAAVPPPARKPSRKTVSCENCRARKVKCSRQSPCASCVKRGEECIWKHQPSLPPMPKVFSEEDVHCLEQTIKHLAERLGLSPSEVAALQESFGWRRATAEQVDTQAESSATPSDNAPPAKRQRRASPNEYLPSDLSDCEWEVDPETSHGETTSTGVSSVLPSPDEDDFPEESEPAKPVVEQCKQEEQAALPKIVLGTPTMKSPCGFYPSPSPSPYCDDYNMDYSTGGFTFDGLRMSEGGDYFFNHSSL